MRVLKVFCVIVCLVSAGRFVAIVHGIRLSQADSMLTTHSVIGMVGLLVIVLVYAVEFYGIHTKALFAWKLGWGILAATFLQFVLLGGSSALKVPETDHPWVALVAVVVVGSLVALYWSLWWKRQKDYFTAQSPTIPSKGTKELVGVLCLAALAFAALTLFSRQTAKYQEPANQAVKQFHEQLAAEQYAAIYDGADETLRRTITESDFVNSLQSVHQKLGNVQDLNLSSTVIAWQGGGKKSIRLTYDTKFAYGTGTEQFVWQDHDNRVTLARYEIKSKALTAQ